MSKELCCGNCSHFQHEDAEGSGYCQHRGRQADCLGFCGCHQDKDKRTAIKGWVARDKSGKLWIYIDEKPKKDTETWVTDGWIFNEIKKGDIFPSVKWEDPEPTEVEITIKIKEK